MYISAQFGFILLTILCIWLIDRVFFARNIIKEERRLYRKRFFIATFVWISLVSALSLSGFLSDFSTIPPRLFIVFIIPLMVFFVLYFNKSFISYLPVVSVHKIILLQAFRVPVELLLWMLYKEGTLPEQMTFEQCNLDILSGLSAPIMAYFLYKNPPWARKLGIAWNIIGLLLLLNIVSVAILSTPIPIRLFMNEPANTVVALFPFSFLPAFLVPMAYYLHFISLRQLWGRR